MTNSSQFPFYRRTVIQIAAFSSSAFLLGSYPLQSSEAATIEKSKAVTGSEILQFYPIIYLKTHSYAHTHKFKGHINFTHCFFNNNNKDLGSTNLCKYLMYVFLTSQSLFWNLHGMASLSLLIAFQTVGKRYFEIFTLTNI